jgi:hypothetical protein
MVWGWFKTSRRHVGGGSGGKDNQNIESNHSPHFSIINIIEPQSFKHQIHFIFG